MLLRRLSSLLPSALQSAAGKQAAPFALTALRQTPQTPFAPRKAHSLGRMIGPSIISSSSASSSAPSAASHPVEARPAHELAAAAEELAESGLDAAQQESRLRDLVGIRAEAHVVRGTARGLMSAALATPQKVALVCRLADLLGGAGMTIQASAALLDELLSRQHSAMSTGERTAVFQGLLKVWNMKDVLGPGEMGEYGRDALALPIERLKSVAGRILAESGDPGLPQAMLAALVGALGGNKIPPLFVRQLADHLSLGMRDDAHGAPLLDSILKACGDNAARRDGLIEHLEYGLLDARARYTRALLLPAGDSKKGAQAESGDPARAALGIAESGEDLAAKVAGLRSVLSQAPGMHYQLAVDLGGAIMSSTAAGAHKLALMKLLATACGDTPDGTAAAGGLLRVLVLGHGPQASLALRADVFRALLVAWGAPAIPATAVASMARDILQSCAPRATRAALLRELAAALGGKAMSGDMARSLGKPFASPSGVDGPQQRHFDAEAQALLEAVVESLGGRDETSGVGEALCESMQRAQRERVSSAPTNDSPIGPAFAPVPLP